MIKERLKYCYTSSVWYLCFYWYKITDECMDVVKRKDAMLNLVFQRGYVIHLQNLFCINFEFCNWIFILLITLRRQWARMSVHDRTNYLTLNSSSLTLLCIADYTCIFFKGWWLLKVSSYHIISYIKISLSEPFWEPSVNKLVLQYV